MRLQDSAPREIPGSPQRTPTVAGSAPATVHVPFGRSNSSTLEHSPSAGAVSAAVAAAAGINVPRSTAIPFKSPPRAHSQLEDASASPSGSSFLTSVSASGNNSLHSAGPASVLSPSQHAVEVRSGSARGPARLPGTGSSSALAGSSSFVAMDSEAGTPRVVSAVGSIGNVTIDSRQLQQPAAPAKAPTSRVNSDLSPDREL